MTRTLQLPFAPGHTWEISNHFNDPATRYLYPEGSGHDGIDWACPTGTPIYAMAAGTVDRVLVGEATGAWNGEPKLAYGNYVLVASADDAGRYELSYAHLAVALVREGDPVQAGDLIGVSGNTGYSTGSHLHVRYRPRPYDSGNGFNGALDFAQWLDATVEVLCAVQPHRQLYVRAQVGRDAVALYGEPRAGDWSYARKLKASEKYPLVGADSVRRVPQAARAAEVDAAPVVPIPAWWQIDVPELPVAWVRRAETEVVDATNRPFSGMWPHVVRTWPAAHDVRARYLRRQEGQKPDAYRIMSAADAGQHLKTLESDDWHPILDQQRNRDLSPPTALWYRIRYGAEAGDEGWVRRDAVETKAFPPRGAALYEPVPPAGPYLQAKAGLAAPVDVRAKPTRARRPLGFIATNSRQKYRIEGRNGARRWGWWQIDFHGDIGWVHKDLVDAHQTENVPWTWHPYVRRAPGETELVLRAGPGTAYAVRRRVRGDAARLHYVKNKDAEAPAWWRVGTYEWVQNDHVQVQGDPRRVVRAAAPALGPSGPPYARLTARAPVPVHQVPGRQRAALTYLDPGLTVSFRIVGRQAMAGEDWWQLAVHERLRGWVRGADVTTHRGAAAFTALAQLSAWAAGAAVVRLKPSHAYARVGTLTADGTTRYALRSKDSTADWWQIQFSDTATGWVRGADAELHGDLRAVATTWTWPQLRLNDDTDKLNLRAGPSMEHAILHQLTKLTKGTCWYPLLGQSGTSPRWWQIRYSEIMTGWVHGDYVETDAHEEGVSVAEVPVTWGLPPAAVTSVMAAAQGPRALAVSWQAPASGPAPTGYAVRYKEADAAAWTAHPHAGTATRTEIGDLAMGTAYAVQVQALRDAVPGVWVPGQGTTASVPQVSLKTGVTAGLNVRSGPGTDYARVGGIEGGSTQTYDIVGKDADPESWWQIRFSDTVTGWVHKKYVQTHGDTTGVAVTWLAAEVTALAVAAESARALAASWQASARGGAVTGRAAPTGGSTPTGYAVEYKRQAATAWTAHAHAGTATRASIGGLAVGAAYDVRVCATRGALRGLWATGQATTTAVPQLSLKATTTLGLNVRRGPGVAYPRVGAIAGGSPTRYDIVGKDAATAGWWQIRYRAAVTGWVHKDYAQTHGVVSGVAVTWTLQAVRTLAGAPQGARALAVRWQMPARGRRRRATPCSTGCRVPAPGRPTRTAVGFRTRGCAA